MFTHNASANNQTGGMVTETDKCRSSGSHQPPTPTTTVKNMDQHLFVQWCLEQYQKDDKTTSRPIATDLKEHTIHCKEEWEITKSH